MKTQVHATLFLCAVLLLLSGGCAVFRQQGAAKSDNATTEALFESQREQGSKMSAFVASAGQKNRKEKKPVTEGEAFLLTDKAKEIYANTER
ncbi:MAG: hypothetical protein ACOX6D_03420 [Thermoguttaceae bacterium]|jgi:hypothetical protein